MHKSSSLFHRNPRCVENRIIDAIICIAFFSNESGYRSKIKLCNCNTVSLSVSQSVSQSLTHLQYSLIVVTMISVICGCTLEEEK